MRKVLLCSMILLLICVCTASVMAAGSATKEAKMKEQKLLRHVVLFSFKESASPEDIKTVEEAFRALPGKIDGIHDFEWGTDVSPEGLAKGFTHCFFLTFKSAEDRDAYLPHPAHKAFGQVLRPHLEDVCVVDYWARK